MSLHLFRYIYKKLGIDAKSSSLVSSKNLKCGAFISPLLHLYNFFNEGTSSQPRSSSKHLVLLFSFSDQSIILPTIIVGTLVIVFGLPFFSVANVSLYSKITDERTQGK